MVAQSPIVRLDAVSLGYPGRLVLERVHLTIRPGDYLGVVGPNGAGKTTLLLSMLGVLTPIEGTIERSDTVRVGYVPQRGMLDEIFPFTVEDVVLMGRAMVPEADAFDLAAVLEQVGMAGLGGRRYRELSGGQKQRVLLARALAGRPDLLVLDEPTNGLDLPSEQAIMEIIDRLHAQGRSIVLVTHLLNLVANHAGTLALVGEGQVITGTTSELLEGERLAAIYGRPVRVVTVEGERVVLTQARR